MSVEAVSAELRQVLRDLKLSGILDTLPERVELARQAHLPYPEFLTVILADEVARRERVSTTVRARAARLDATMTLDGWDDSTEAVFDRDLWAELCTLRFVEARRDLIVMGPVGVGKTFMASALGHIACRRRFTALAGRCDQILKRLRGSRLDGSHDLELRKLIRVDVLLLDDFCLQSLDPADTADIYEVIVERHRRATTIVTTNREPPGEWLAAMADPLLAESAIDRLTSNAYQLVVDGPSYRQRQRPGRAQQAGPAPGAGPKRTLQFGGSAEAGVRLRGYRRCPMASLVDASIEGQMSGTTLTRLRSTGRTSLTGADREQLERLTGNRSRAGSRLLIRGATIVTMDPAIGDLLVGDVLVDGAQIVDVAPAIRAEAEIIDAAGMIACPGMHDTHRHSWQGALRRLIPSGLINLYMSAIHFGVGPHFQPQDVYVGNLITALQCIDSGITGLLDYSHIRRSADHADAALQGLVDAGIRARYACAAPLEPSLVGSSAEMGPYDGGWPDDLVRIKEAWCPSEDQLVTLGIALLPYHVRHEPRILEMARDLDVRISVDGFSGRFASNLLARSLDRFAPDVTVIHCLDLDPMAWRILADTGTNVSLAPTSEPSYEMFDGTAPIRQALEAGIRPSLSVDADVGLSSDMFSQMRMVFQTHRMSVARDTYEGDPRMMASRSGPRPLQITIRDAFEFASLRGAEANGVLSRSGTLSPGKDADIVLIDANDINNMPLNNAYGTIVLGSDSKSVRTVLIGGEVRKLHGELVGVDLADLRTLVGESRDRVLAAAGRELDVFSIELGDDYWS